MESYQASVKGDGGMKIRTTCVAFFALLAVQKGEAASFKDAGSFVASMEQNGERLAYESTTDNHLAEGKDDIVILMHSTHASRSGYQLAVLVKNHGNSFDLLEMSKFGDSSDGFNAKLNNERSGSLFVSVDSPSGFWGTYQFKLMDRSMILVGSEIHLSNCQSDQDRCTAVDTSTNFLTGNVVFHRKIIGGAKSKDLWRKDKVDLPRCELKNFDFNPYFCVENTKTSKGTLDALMRGEG